RPGIAVGTPEYMAPEQARGDKPTPSIDIYALGVLMFELLCGEPPFMAANPLEILGRKAVSPAPSIARRREGLPTELVEIVDSCLGMEPEDRPKTAHELGTRLDALVESSKEIERVVAPGATVATRRGLEPWAVAVVSALVLGTAVVVGWPTDDERAQVHAASAIETPVEPEPEPTPIAPEPIPPTPAPAPVIEPPPVASPEPPEPAPPTAAPTKRSAKSKSRVLPRVVPDAPEPEVAKTSSADSEECVRTRREAEDARNNHDWNGLLRHTQKGSCWPTGSARKKLRVKAMMELNRFDDCVQLGQGVTDTEVVGWVQTCSKRRDAKG
ncbi:MAG TPA: protein kinase, partial [Nannocystaceae bacterium]|nr:protein kinase [Nannocystaceae bacterium]